MGSIDDKVDGWFDEAFKCAGFNDAKETMLLMAYVQLLTPLLSVLFNFICQRKNKDADQKAGSGIGLTGIVSVVSGALYLAFYYKVIMIVIIHYSFHSAEK